MNSQIGELHSMLVKMEQTVPYGAMASVFRFIKDELVNKYNIPEQLAEEMALGMQITLPPGTSAADVEKFKETAGVLIKILHNSATALVEAGFSDYAQCFNRIAQKAKLSIN